MAKEKKEKKKHPVLKTFLIALLVLILGGGLFLFFIIWNAYKEFEDETNAGQVAIVGTEAPDFTVTTVEGEEITLSKLLEDKDMVLLNVFATWCGPCEREFPVFEKYYQQYGDKMEIIAVSDDSDDTVEKLAQYKADHGLSFSIGQAGDAIGFAPVLGYPTTLIIDREGVVRFCQSGTMTSEETFEDLITTFVDDSYSGTSVFLYSFFTYADNEYVPGVTLKITDDDGNVTEITTDEDAGATLKTDKPHTYTVEVTAAPEGFSSTGETAAAGPSSGVTMVKLKKK